MKSSLFSRKDSSVKIIEQYSINKLTQNGKTYLLRFNKWLWNIAGEEDYPFQVGFATKLKTNNNGFPDKNENLSLTKIEDLLINKLEKVAIFAGTITGGGIKEFVFYARFSDEVTSIYEKLRKAIKDYDLQCIIKKDPTWEVFKRYCPK